MARQLVLAYIGALAVRLLVGDAWSAVALVLGPPAALAPWWWYRRARSKVRASGNLLERRRARKVGERWLSWWPTKLPGSRIIEMAPDAAGGWSGVVELPDGDTMASVEPKIASLESTLQLRPDAIKVEQDPANRRRVRVRVQVGDPITDPVPWPGAPPDASILRPATIGQFLDGDALKVPLRGECILVAGRRGAGKSGVLNALIGYLSACQDAALFGIDLKGGLELKPWARVFASGGIARTLPDAVKLLRALKATMEARMAEMAGADRDWPYSPTHPAIVLVIDEQSLVKGDKQAIALLEELVILGRALGIVVIFATQYPTKTAIGSPALVEQITVTIGLRVRSATASRVLFGEQADREGWRPHEIPADAKGTLYIEAPGADRPRLARAWYVTDAKVRATVGRYAGQRPELRIPLDTARPGLAMIPPAGQVQGQDTESDNAVEAGGGVDDVLPILRAAGEPLQFSIIVTRSTASRATVHRRLDAYKAAQPPQVEQLGDGSWRAI
jgi:S-DNA-T family DNA segregation ATPase FtsK/SpoIIIE